MKINILILSNLVLLTLTIFSQNLYFELSGPKNVTLNKQFQLVYTFKAENQGVEFVKPALNDFNIINISTSNMSSFSSSYVNGKMETVNSYTTIWYVTVQAKKEGTFTIPAGNAKLKNKTYTSNSLTITVTQGTQQVTNSNNNTPQNKESFDEEIPSTSEPLLLNVSTNKSNVYVGEPVYTFIKMYSLYSVNLADYKPGTFDNFWTKDIQMPSSIQAQETKYNGKTYITATIDKKVAFPQKSGDLTISSFNATFQIYDSWGFPAGTRKVVSNKKVIHVKPLPAGKPTSFTGAVGDFSIKSKISVDSISVDKPLTLELEISGTGNIGLFDIPEFNVSNTFEKIDPQVTEKTTISETGITGNYTVSTTYIPRVPGTYTIPELSFSYFDPKKEKYITLKTNAYEIKIIGDTSKSTENSQNIVKSEIQELANDIRFIKTNQPKFNKINNFLYGKIEFWLMYIIPFLTFLIIVFFLRKKIQENANVNLVRFKNAEKVSVKKLKIAENLLKQNKLDDFYQETNKAIWGYLSDKLSIPLSELTRSNVSDILINKDFSQEIISNIIKIIDYCETARFAPVMSKSNADLIYNQAITIIAEIEKISKTKV